MPEAFACLPACLLLALRRIVSHRVRRKQQQNSNNLQQRYRGGREQHNQNLKTITATSTRFQPNTATIYNHNHHYTGEHHRPSGTAGLLLAVPHHRRRPAYQERELSPRAGAQETPVGEPPPAVGNSHPEHAGGAVVAAQLRQPAHLRRSLGACVTAIGFPESPGVRYCRNSVVVNLNPEKIGRCEKVVLFLTFFSYFCLHCFYV